MDSAKQETRKKVEEEAMLEMAPEEKAKLAKELARHRHLMSQQELKQSRANKIKSKTFRKIAKKEKERIRAIERADDPAKAEEYRAKMEQQKLVVCISHRTR